MPQRPVWQPSTPSCTRNASASRRPTERDWPHRQSNLAASRCSHGRPDQLNWYRDSHPKWMQTEAGVCRGATSLMESDRCLLRVLLAAPGTEREELLQQGDLATGRRRSSAFGSAWETDVEDSEKSEGLREESTAYEMGEVEEEERVQGKDLSVDLRLKIHEVPLSKPGLQIKEENQDGEKGLGLVDRWNPWQHEPIEANQMTALVIELQQLRTACEETSSTLPVSPKDQRAREWM